MKIIITISLYLAVWLAAPTARADAKDDFCESHRLGMRAFEAIERDVLPDFLARSKLAGGAMAKAKSIHRRFCTGHEYLTRNRWNLLSKSDKCTSASAWDQIMVRMYAFFLAQDEIYVPQTILNDFASAGDASRRAMDAMGCQ